MNRDEMSDNVITVVSGLPRSGTSMMMKMLEAGGMEVLTDTVRKADEDNPKGYFEYEKVKELEKDSSWVGEARGKVLKVITALLEHLPDEFHYKVIFMRRKMEEILQSQKEMLVRRGAPTDDVGDEEMGQLFSSHIQSVEEWLENRSNVEVVYVHYNEILRDPVTYCETINRFLGRSLDTESMSRIVDKSLHRQKDSSL
jgi:hypothetical protein